MEPLTQNGRVIGLRKSGGRQEAGFTLIGLLIATAILMIGVGLTLSVWHTLVMREKEKELLFIGHQFRQAIATYYRNSGRQFPMNVEDLVAQPNARPLGTHPLRRVSIDPMTGKKQWGYIRNQQSRLIGIYSLSDKKPIKQAGFIDEDKAFANAATYADWKFIYVAPLDNGDNLFMPRPSPFVAPN